MEGLADLVGTVAVDGDDFPVPGFVFLGHIFAGDCGTLGGELDVVGIVEHDQVVQPEGSGYAACALGDFFLHASVGDVGIDGLAHDFLAKPCLQEFGGYGGSHGVAMALAERAGGVFDAAHHVYLGMAGAGRAPLAEGGEFVHGELAGQGQNGVKHGGHVAGVEEETVAALPAGILGVID